MGRWRTWVPLLVTCLNFGCSRNRTVHDHAPEAASQARPGIKVASEVVAAHVGASALPAQDDLMVVAALSPALPALAHDFTSGPLETTAIFVRREYTRGATRISVTIAKPDAAVLTYAAWERSLAPYPQLASDMFPKIGSGFYDCAPATTGEQCNVHIHLRSGHHVEMMGVNHAQRGDFDALLKYLPLATLAST